MWRAWYLCWQNDARLCLRVWFQSFVCICSSLYGSWLFSSPVIWVGTARFHFIPHHITGKINWSCYGGWTGEKCDISDPCYNHGCSPGSLCVSVPIEQREKYSLGYTCLCEINQDPDFTGSNNSMLPSFILTRITVSVASV